MHINHLGKDHSLIGSFMAELRDVVIQQDKFRFRTNIERLGQILAYEVSKTLTFEPIKVKTPLGEKIVFIPKDKIVIASILRAGLPLHQGILSYFDKAENIFIAAYRKHTEGYDFDIQLDYVSGPSVDQKILILADPMLATASSLVKVYRTLTKETKPLHTHIVSVISAVQGIRLLENELKGENVSVWTCAIDEELDQKSYIVPGLGDAGDLAFGEKL